MTNHAAEDASSPSMVTFLSFISFY